MRRSRASETNRYRRRGNRCSGAHTHTPGIWWDDYNARTLASRWPHCSHDSSSPPTPVRRCLRVIKPMSSLYLVSASSCVLALFDCHVRWQLARRVVHVHDAPKSMKRPSTLNLGQRREISNRRPCYLKFRLAVSTIGPVHGLACP
jgi:hypothetical protein